MEPPKEPPCPKGRKPHRDRVKEIDGMLLEGHIGGICIDNTDEHKAWYLHELTKYPRLSVVFQGTLTRGMYLIKVLKGPSLTKEQSCP